MYGRKLVFSQEKTELKHFLLKKCTNQRTPSLRGEGRGGVNNKLILGTVNQNYSSKLEISFKIYFLMIEKKIIKNTVLRQKRLLASFVMNKKVGEPPVRYIDGY